MKRFHLLYSKIPSSTNAPKPRCRRHATNLPRGRPFRRLPYSSKIYEQYNGHPEEGIPPLRLVLDNRQLNFCTPKIPSALPSQNEILQTFHDASFVTAMKYPAIPLTENSRDFTAFYSPSRKLQRLKRLPMGYKNSTAILENILQQTFSGFTSQTSKLSFYADDIILTTTSSFQDHLQYLDKALSLLTSGGFKLK